LKEIKEIVPAKYLANFSFLSFQNSIQIFIDIFSLVNRKNLFHIKMSTTFLIGLILLGLFAGFISGVVGIGGGVIIVPILVMLFGYTEHTAQGTTLALLILPLGLLAAYSYWQKGYIDIKAALLISAGFIIGGYFGGKFAVLLSDQVLKKVFAIILLFIAAKLLFFTKG